MLTFEYMIPKEISTPSITVLGSGIYVPSYTLVLPFLGLPTLHVPKELSELSLPEFKVLSTINKILIPALGNMTYDFSFKSSVITLNTNVGLYNQSDIVAHFLLHHLLSCWSALQYKLEGTSSLTRKRGLKLAAALSHKGNRFVEGNHDSTVVSPKKIWVASVTTTARVQIPILKMTFKQQLHGNTKSKPAVSSVIELKYNFNSPKLLSAAMGAVTHKLTLKASPLTFPLSHLQRKCWGFFDFTGIFRVSCQWSQHLLEFQGHQIFCDTARSLQSRWSLGPQSKRKFCWRSKTTLQRIYTIWEQNIKNTFRARGLILTSGEHTSKATLELSLWKYQLLFRSMHISPVPSLNQLPWPGSLLEC